MSWYGWHGRAVAEPAGKGTRADERLAHEMALALGWASYLHFAPKSLLREAPEVSWAPQKSRHKHYEKVSVRCCCLNQHTLSMEMRLSAEVNAIGS